MATFHLQIVTPDRKVFDGEAEKIILRTVDGDACILARHIDYAVALGIGEAKITDAEGKTRSAACNGGFLSVSGGEVRVLPISFEWADEISLERAKIAKENAEKQLSSLSREDVNYTLAEAKLKRALIRIHIKENN